MTGRIINVLILCAGNSARSILAEGILNRFGGGRFRAWSAGSQPKGEVHPHALRHLKALEYDTDFARSKSWDEFSDERSPVMDIVITVCDNAAGEACPVWPGQPLRAHWGIADPAVVTGADADIADAFAKAYSRLKTRIQRFVTLPVEDMDQETLQRALDEIGKTNESSLAQ